MMTLLTNIRMASCILILELIVGGLVHTVCQEILFDALLSLQFSSDEDHLFCTCNDKIQVVQIQTGKVVQTLREVSIHVKHHMMMGP